jgi:hypothetical protein
MYTAPCSRRSAGSSGRRWVFACAARPLPGCARARPSHFRRANKSARGGFNSRALHSRPGIRIYSMRMRARSEFASIAAEINLKPGPGWELPAAAQGAHPAITGYPSSRCRAGMLLCGIGLHCTCTHMRMRIRMPGRARVRSPWAQARFFLARRQCDGPARMQPRKGMLRKKQGWPERRRSCSCRGALRATASPKQTDHPFKHDCTVFASIYSCYHECIHVSYPPHHN